MTDSTLQKVPILLLLALLLTACGRGHEPQLPYLSPDAVILAFGDSLTHGSGAKRGQAYPTILEGLIERRVVTVATPGDQTDAGLRKLPEALAAHEPELLILCLGGNDFLRKRPEAEIVNNLRQMIEMARAAGSAVVLLGVPKPGIFGLDGHQLYEKLAEEYELVLDNSTIPDILSERSLRSDAIHPNAAGYRQLAEAVAELLRDAGAV